MGEPQGSGPRGGELGLLGSGDHRTFRTEIPLVLGKRDPGHLWGVHSVRILKYSRSVCPESSMPDSPLAEPHTRAEQAVG